MTACNLNPIQETLRSDYWRVKRRIESSYDTYRNILRSRDLLMMKPGHAPYNKHVCIKMKRQDQVRWEFLF